MATDRVMVQMYQVETALERIKHNLLCAAPHSLRRVLLANYRKLLSDWRTVDDHYLTQNITSYIWRGNRTWAREQGWEARRLMQRLDDLKRRPL